MHALQNWASARAIAIRGHAHWRNQKHQNWPENLDLQFEQHSSCPDQQPRRAESGQSRLGQFIFEVAQRYWNGKVRSLEKQENFSTNDQTQLNCWKFQQQVHRQEHNPRNWKNGFIVPTQTLLEVERHLGERRDDFLQTDHESHKLKQLEKHLEDRGKSDAARRWKWL